MEIQITQGKVVLQKPKAGARNKAMIESTGPEGNQNNVKFMVELLPHCILSHPFGTVPVRQALDSLEIDEYDNLVEGLGKLLGMDELKKKQDSSRAQLEGQG